MKTRYQVNSNRRLRRRHSQYWAQVGCQVSPVSSTLIPTFLATPLFYFLFSNMLVLELARQELQRIASTDSLTGVLNRRAFTALVECFLIEAGQNEEAPRTGAFLMIDADFFKNINDVHGHHAGDVALKKIASTICESVRDTDFVGRLGGEEFGVFLPGTEASTAVMTAERIRQTIEKIPIGADKTAGHLSVSIGVVAFNRAAQLQDLYSIADRQLYSAKGLGRNRVQIDSFPPSLNMQPSFYSEPRKKIVAPNSLNVPTTHLP